jgi:hypothetical protein
LPPEAGTIAPIAGIPSRPIIIALLSRLTPFPLRCGDEAIPPIGAILCTALTVGSLARPRCRAADCVALFARFPDPSGELLGSFRRFRRLNGAHWVRFAIATGSPPAADSCQCGRSWGSFCEFRSHMTRPRLPIRQYWVRFALAWPSLTPWPAATVLNILSMHPYNWLSSSPISVTRVSHRQHAWSQPMCLPPRSQPLSMSCSPRPDRPGHPSSELSKRDSLVRRRKLANHSVILAGIPKSWSSGRGRSGRGCRPGGSVGR